MVTYFTNIYSNILFYKYIFKTHTSMFLSYRDHVNVVSGCGFSHNGHYLATCSWDKTVRVYDVMAGGYRQRGPTLLSEHVGSVSACTFSRDGESIHNQS